MWLSVIHEVTWLLVDLLIVLPKICLLNRDGLILRFSSVILPDMKKDDFNFLSFHILFPDWFKVGNDIITEPIVLIYRSHLKLSTLTSRSFTMVICDLCNNFKLIIKSCGDNQISCEIHMTIVVIFFCVRFLSMRNKRKWTIVFTSNF